MNTAPEKRSGILTRTFRGVKRVGRFYLWTVAGNLEELKRNTKAIKDGVGQILNRKFQHETFEEAVKRLQLTEEWLDKRASYLSAVAFLYGLVAVIALLFLFASRWSAHPINHGFMSFGVFAVAGSKFLSTRFRVAEIRKRRFFDFVDWLLRREGSW